MAIAFVQQTSFGNSLASSVSKSYTSTVGAGNLLVVVGRHNASLTLNTFSDDQSNTWVEHFSVLYDSNNTRFHVWSAVAVNGNNPNVTMTVSGGSGRLGLVLFEASGSFDGSRLNDDAQATGSGTSASSGNVTTTVADALLVGILGTASTPGASLGSGYSNLIEETTGRLALESKVVSGTVTDDADFGLSSQLWGCACAAFVEAGGGGGGGAARVLIAPVGFS